ncbi:MAG: hypothetical protein LBS51_00780 [Oscillospiraceae bacterium]|jgi:ABC-type transporter Mla subunit MlaD|nr:hypothetical protein [Oscillospiraceae bacterium]
MRKKPGAPPFGARKIVRRGAAALLAALLVLAASCSRSDGPLTGGGGGDSAPGAPQDAVWSKEEVVYALLAADGGLLGEYVVNILDVARGGLVTDYGDYDDVKDLTGGNMIENTPGEHVTLSVGEGRAYYQGDAHFAPLPWGFDITYELDGSRVSPEYLPGVSGRLLINIKTAARPMGDYDAYHKYFTENYLLQITVKLGSASCSGILAPGAVQANAGRDRVLSYTVMPGADADLRIECDVSDFEMEGIEISALPFSSSFETPELGGVTGRFDELTDGVAALAAGARQLGEGARSLAGGMRTLAKGAGEFDAGLRGLSASSARLTEGSAQIGEALKTIDDALASQDMPDISQLSQLPAVLQRLAGSLAAAKDGLAELEGAYAEGYAALDAAIEGIPERRLSDEAVAALRAAAPGHADTVDALAASYAASEAVRAAYGAAKPAFEAVRPAITAAAESMNSAAGTLLIVAMQAQGVSDIDIAGQLGQLTDAISEISANYGDFHSGLAAYADGLGELARAGGELAGGISEAADGADKFANDGFPEFQAGLDALNGEVGKIPGEIDEQIDEIMDGYGASGAKPVSFTSPKNENVTLVQFVIRTEKIAIPASPAPVEPEPEAESFMTRLLNLFRS